MQEVLDANVILLQPSMAYNIRQIRQIGYRQLEGIAYTDNEWDIYPMLNVKSIVYIIGNFIIMVKLGVSVNPY